MGRPALFCRRGLTATLAVIVIALAALSPASSGSSDDPRIFSRPVMQAAGSPHLALVANERGKQQIIGIHLAVLSDNTGLVPISFGAGILRSRDHTAASSVLLRRNGSRAPPQLLRFA